MALFRLKNLIKTGASYTGYKMLAILFRVKPNYVNDLNINKINDVVYGAIPELVVNQHYTISGSGDNASIDLIMNNIYTDMSGVFGSAKIAKIVDNNDIWYVAMGYVNNGIAQYSAQGGIRYLNSSNLDIDVDTTGFQSDNEPNLTHVALFGLSNYHYCTETSVTRIGLVPVSYI